MLSRFIIILVDDSVGSRLSKMNPRHFKTPLNLIKKLCQPFTLKSPKLVIHLQLGEFLGKLRVGLIHARSQRSQTI